MKKLIIILFAVLFATGLSAQKAEMRLNLKTGKEYYHKQTTDVVIAQNAMGSVISVSTKSNTTTSWRVKSFSNGVYEFGVTYRHLSSHVNSDYGSTFASSDSTNAEDVTSALLRAMTGTEFTVKMTEKCKILEVSGFERLMRDAVAAVEKETTATPEMLSAMSAMYSKDIFIAGVETIMGYFPATAVATGDTWNVESIMNSSGFRFDNKSVYEYTGNENGNALIHGRSHIVTLPGSMVESMGITFDVNLRGTMDYDIKADLTTNWISESILKQDIQGTFSRDVPMQGVVSTDVYMDSKMVTVDSE